MQLLDLMSPRKDLDNAIAASADDKSTIRTPADVANTFAAHGSVRDDVLCADSLFERPEADTSVVASRDSFPAVFRQ